MTEYVGHVEKLMQLELDLMHAVDEHDEAMILEQRRLLSAEAKAAAHGDAALEKKLIDSVDLQH